MHRGISILGLGLVVTGCDPAISSSLRVTPVSSPSADGGALRSNALTAVERLALQFGLAPAEGRSEGCERVWVAYNYPRGPRQVRGGLSVCVLRSTDERLEVRIGEGITTCWSPKADSLRRALADTLASFGSVRDSVIQRSRCEPPNDR